MSKSDPNFASVAWRFRCWTALLPQGRPGARLGPIWRSRGDDVQCKVEGAARVLRVLAVGRAGGRVLPARSRWHTRGDSLAPVSFTAALFGPGLKRRAVNGDRSATRGLRWPRRTETGERAPADPVTAGWREQTRCRVFQGKTWNPPALAEHLPFVRHAAKHPL